MAKYADDFFREESFQKAWLEAEVLGWYKLPQNYSNPMSNLSAIRNQILDIAAADGHAIDKSNRAVVLLFADMPGMSLASGGCGSYMNSSLQKVPFCHIEIDEEFLVRSPKTLHHELTHVLGGKHACALDCRADSVSKNLAGCQSIEYGDIYDSQGVSYGPVGAATKEKLSWLGAASTEGPFISNVTKSGIYKIAPDTTAGGLILATETRPRALKIRVNDYLTYYIEKRTPVGFDARPFMILDVAKATLNRDRGVIVRAKIDAAYYTNLSSGCDSFLIDTTPRNNFESGYDNPQNRNPAVIYRCALIRGHSGH